MDFFPPSPLAGSNAIGSFTIGVSPIGTISPFNWQDTVISQYGNSPRLLTLIENFNGYIDQTTNLDAFFDKMWNIDTAEGYGLDVWGRIVGVSRIINVVDDETTFGFLQGDLQPFGQGTFFAQFGVTTNYRLTDSAYRMLILAKALANICDDSIPAINRLLMTMFPNRGNAYVTEGLGAEADFLGFSEAGGMHEEPFGQAPFYSGQTFDPMKMTYTFRFNLTPVEYAIVTQSGVLPTPCGVTATIVINPP